MRQSGEGVPSDQEANERVGLLINELHYAVVTALLEGKDGMVDWLAADESARYIATNSQDIVIDKSELSMKDAYRAVSPNWEIMRLVANPQSSKADVTIYLLSQKDGALKMDVFRAGGMPTNPADVELVSHWKINERNNRARQIRLGMTDPTDQDYQELESALSELQVLNEIYHPDERFAFDITARQARNASG